LDREASPTAGIIDSQSVKSVEPFGKRRRGRHIDPVGYDAGKKIKGKKRHILVDALGLLLHAVVHPADIQNRDGGGLVLSTLFGLYPFLQKLFADGGYQGPVIQKASAKLLPNLENPQQLQAASMKGQGLNDPPRRELKQESSHKNKHVFRGGR
jgi:putative transposase